MSKTILSGRTIGHFEVVSEVGHGGMALVFKARQIPLDRVVALKVLRPELSYDRQAVVGFQREAESAAVLEHPHIVPIYAVDEMEGFHCIAMKYIHGTTLGDLIHERRLLDLPQTLAILSQVAEALDYAHCQGIVHRDIKPSNILIDHDSRVYLTDFGLAHASMTPSLTPDGKVVGTPAYMAPEQALPDSAIGPAADIYALGIVLYELLTGRLPFEADTPQGMLLARLQHPPRPPRKYCPDLPHAVEQVMLRALARDPAARYRSAGALIVAFKMAAGLEMWPFVGPQISDSVQDQTTTPTQTAPLVLVRRTFDPADPLWLGAAAPPAPPSHRPSAPQARDPVQSPPISLEPAPASPQTDPAPVLLPRPAPPLTLLRVAIQSNLSPSSIVSANRPHPAKALTFMGRLQPSQWIPAGGGVITLLLMLGVVSALLGREDPQIARALQEGATALAQPGGFERATAVYQHIIAIDMRNAAAHAQLARIYNLQGQPQKALQEARAALAGGDTRALASAALAEALAQQGDYDAARTAADQAIQSDRSLSGGYVACAIVAARQAVESSDASLLRQAAADADQAIILAADEDDLAKALAHNARGYVFWQQYLLTGDQTSAARGVEEFRRAIGLQGQIALFRTNLGAFYEAQGESQQAFGQFKEALNIDSDYGYAHAGMGWNLYNLGIYRGALNEFNEATRVNVWDMDAYIGQSRVYQAQGQPDYKAAIGALQQAAQIAPKSPRIFSELGWAHRGRAAHLPYGSQDQKAGYTEAEAQFRKALELNPNFIDALTGLGWVLFDQAAVLQQAELYQQAIQALQRSLALKESQPHAHTALGWSYYRRHAFDRAEAAFRRATELKEAYADAFFGLGQALQAQGKIDAARAAYRKGRDNGSANATRALERLR